MTIKYLASYHGPAYGSLDQEYMEGYESLYDATSSVRWRQAGRMDEVCEYKENPEGIYESQGSVELQFLASTRDDYMDVYYAITEDDGYILGEWAYRITVGPRGGIRAERA